MNKVFFPPGSITMEDLLSVLPFGGRFDTVMLKGSTLKEAFEHSVRRYGLGSGELLQVAGIFSSFLLSVFQNIHPSCCPYYIWKASLKNGMSGWPYILALCLHMPASRCCLFPVCLIEPLQHTGHRYSLQHRQCSQAPEPIMASV